MKHQCGSVVEKRNTNMASWWRKSICSSPPTWPKSQWACLSAALFSSPSDPLGHPAPSVSSPAFRHTLWGTPGSHFSFLFDILDTRVAGQRRWMDQEKGCEAGWWRRCPLPRPAPWQHRSQPLRWWGTGPCPPLPSAFLQNMARCPVCSYGTLSLTKSVAEPGPVWRILDKGQIQPTYRRENMWSKEIKESKDFVYLVFPL